MLQSRNRKSTQSSEEDYQGEENTTASELPDDQQEVHLHELNDHKKNHSLLVAVFSHLERMQQFLPEFNHLTRFIVLLVILIVFLEVLLFRYQFTYAPTIDYYQHKNILLIGDPQLTDRYSYSFVNDEFSILSRFIFMLCDTFMRKNFQSILRMNRNNIHVIIFMGDLFDNGRRITDDEYERELKRFRKIFENKDGISTIYLSGNHDIGLEHWEKKILDRFEKHHMPLNFNYAINEKMNIVGVNSMYLGTQIWDSLLKNVDSTKHSKNILLTHIPLYRDGACQNDEVDKKHGTKSRSRPLQEGYGFGYRNMLNPSDSMKLISLTQPILVLSGDDHEYCRYQHKINDQTVVEHTIPTFSMLQGTFKYGYGILTVNLDKGSVHDLSIYYLPKIWNIFIFYALLFIFASIYTILKFKSVLSYVAILVACLLTFILCQVWWWVL